MSTKFALTLYRFPDINLRIGLGIRTASLWIYYSFVRLHFCQVWVLCNLLYFLLRCLRSRHLIILDVNLVRIHLLSRVIEYREVALRLILVDLRVLPQKRLLLIFYVHDYNYRQWMMMNITFSNNHSSFYSRHHPSHLVNLLSHSANHSCFNGACSDQASSPA